MSAIRSFGVSLAVLLGATSIASGHGAGFLAVGTPSRVHRELVTIFGASTAFSATARVTWTKPDAVRQQTFPYYYRHGRLRLERDHATNPFLPPSSVDHHRRQGTDVTVTLATPTAIYAIFPRLEAVLTDPARDLPPNEIVAKDLGRETIEGHPCRKRELVLTDETGTTRMIVWNADDLQGIPVRIEDVHDDSTTRLDLTDVKPDPPADLFELPAGYANFSNVEDLLRDRKPKP